MSSDTHSSREWYTENVINVVEREVVSLRLAHAEPNELSTRAYHYTQKVPLYIQCMAILNGLALCS